MFVRYCLTSPTRTRWDFQRKLSGDNSLYRQTLNPGNGRVEEVIHFKWEIFYHPGRGTVALWHCGSDPADQVEELWLCVVGDKSMTSL